MRRLTALAALALFVVIGPMAKALPIFDYSSTVNVASSPALPANPPGFGAAVIGIGNGNSLTFNTVPPSVTGIDATAPGALISPGTIVFNASTTTTQTPFSVNFNYAVTIVDEASATSGVLNLTGNINGSATGSSHSIVDVLTNLNVSPASLTLGTNTYFAFLAPSNGPTSGIGHDGNLQLLITNTNSSIFTPEPGSLMFFGLAGLGMLRRRKTA